MEWVGLKLPWNLLLPPPTMGRDTSQETWHWGRDGATKNSLENPCQVIHPHRERFLPNIQPKFGLCHFESIFPFPITPVPKEKSLSSFPVDPGRWNLTRAEKKERFADSLIYFLPLSFSRYYFPRFHLLQLFSLVWMNPLRTCFFLLKTTQHFKFYDYTDLFQISAFYSVIQKTLF